MSVVDNGSGPMAFVLGMNRHTAAAPLAMPATTGVESYLPAWARTPDSSREERYTLICIGRKHTREQVTVTESTVRSAYDAAVAAGRHRLGMHEISARVWHTTGTKRESPGQSRG